MSYLIGKIKDQYKNILHRDATIIQDLNLDALESHNFSPNNKLEDDELFQLTNFSDTKYFIPECSKVFSISSISQIRNEDYTNLSALIIIQNGRKYFQRITPSLYINQKTFLSYSGEPKIVEQNEQIEIKNTSDAIYIEENDTLYFKDISKLKPIFPGIEELHRAATKEEVSAFISHKFISLSNSINSDNIGLHNRKRIADIGTKYNKLTSEKQQLLIEYAKEKADVEINGNNQFVIKKETDLKKVLYAMDQRYYYADIYEENRIASSVRIVT